MGRRRGQTWHTEQDEEIYIDRDYTLFRHVLTYLRDMLRIELGTLQLISGLCTPVLTTKKDKRLMFPKTRLTSLWDACTQLDVQVHVHSQWLPSLKTISDTCIMEEVLNSETGRPSINAGYTHVR
jgi:hypothetical protein